MNNGVHDDQRGGRLESLKDNTESMLCDGLAINPRNAQLRNTHPSSCVHVAERPRDGAHQVAHGNDFISNRAHLDRRVESGLWTRRIVEESPRPIDGIVAIDAFEGVECLPNPPCSVDGGVVEVEGWFAGRNKDVASWVTTCEKALVLWLTLRW